jgi:hypothetical protein
VDGGGEGAAAAEAAAKAASTVAGLLRVEGLVVEGGCWERMQHASHLACKGCSLSAAVACAAHPDVGVAGATRKCVASRLKSSPQSSAGPALLWGCYPVCVCMREGRVLCDTCIPSWAHVPACMNHT